MLSKNIMLQALFFPLLLALPCQSEENQARQELAWSQSDGLRREIYYSASKDGIWEEPQKLTDNNANNFHPAFVIAPDNTRWIFWSAVNPDGIAIEYLIGKDGKWSEPVKLETTHASSIAPSVLIGQDKAVWLVWAGNDDDGQDEIYCSRYANSVWEKPQQINMANQVPDIKPEILFNEQHQMEVRWQGFRDGVYKKLFSVHTDKGWSAEQEISEDKESKAEETKPQLPDFLPDDSQYVLPDGPQKGSKE